ncbi:MAG: KpsF/GutQ family sugar-phosphate isomerase [Erysipelotrichia bacterium]|jgi:arabinose-5-phosphate isomerase|nr:KpsF/GutQ family sugar-phosphate isomerase [Candidatus Riflebacteria bacterium]MDD3377730.1 KpsF/GutQ family sugar-phosphate isomerase [Candidatus Riflebacteria bacterium]NCB40886.1 KpsF/GutQ family sugar-phosphate isomerase [Erysipelotrichia bacterium]NLV95154.1 KpsF/GutQ family sugar-phosphate isomerase [Candidatus Riflebacteria bacterium]OQB50226.1 MAG: Arabinose 5-phosphate isomerase KdsD [bacterium ADurb.Bin157]
MKNMLESAKRILRYEAEAIETASKNLDENFSKAIDLILNSQGRLVVCGMGKSGLIGHKISATLSSTGTPSFFLHPGEALHGDLGMIRDNDVMLLLSNSGETEEIVKLVPFLRRIGTAIVAMVGETNSSLARMADLVINAHVPREACPLNLAPTSSTTVALALGDAIAGALIEARSFSQRDFARFHPSGSLGRKFVSVKDLMHSGTDIPKASPDMILKDAVVKMSQFGFGALIVCNEENDLLGIFTDGDLRRYFEKAENAELSIPLNKIMTANPKHTTPDRLAMEALKTMEDKSITSLPVAESGKVIGFLHLHDILRSRLV